MKKTEISKVALLVVALLLLGVTAQASGILNSPSGGYLVCVNSKTKVVTHPGTTKCPKGNAKLILGAQGSAGAPGLTGATGLSGKDGVDGKDGKTLWNGVKDPESTWGAPGDMFINSVTKTLFGPKNLDGTWPAGVSLVGPAGERGPIGLTGATGAQGPSGGSGPAGPTGATGSAGSNATLTCAQGGTCALGDTGPGGGIVFYIQTATAAAPWRYMEAAPNTWSGGSADPKIRWCNITNAYVPNLHTGSTSDPQTSTAIGAGYSNTQKMLRGCTYGAANAAASYNGGGKSDWHLPSKDELNQLRLQRTTVGGFSNDSYLTSSESPYAEDPFADPPVPTPNYVWTQFLSSGGLMSLSKASDPIGAVRPVRAF